uniref:NADH dehydrogenase subunit 5 n=1 Tax=Desmaulus extinctorium TaxID=211681 RepID=UPI002551F1FB|nr:NADH dehydrogenase subunit 5 [Desmaulus extinctorium]WGH72838.1 NADH dehydrogenase subunit 5 [Desmaulus extinctorium]
MSNFKVKSSSLSSFFLFLYSFLSLFMSLYFLKFEKSYFIEWTILQVSSCSLEFSILLDYVSLSFSFIVCLISACVMMFSSSYMAADPFLKRFSWLVMLFVMSMNLLVFIPSLPSLLLGWDGLGIVSFVLVIYYQNMKSLGAGMLTILANRIGDVLILISIGLLVLQGHWSITLMFDFQSSSLFSLALVIAAMTKSAQIPFSSWLPAAMAAPTPVSALVHSSTLVTAGVFLVIRFFPFLSTMDFFKPFLLFVSVLTLVLAGVGANFENDLKKVIALSTLSQLGVMMMSLSMGMPLLALFHLYTHAMFKALLFLCAGMIIHNSMNWQDLRSLGMISGQAPLTVACLNIANLSLCGAPFLSGFYSKDLILEIFLTSPSNFIMVVLIFLATGMTASYSFRLSFSSLWSYMKNSPLHLKNEFDHYVNWSTAILASAAVFSGFTLQTMFSLFNYQLVVMPMFMKVLTPAVIISGFYLGYLMWQVGGLTKSSKILWFLASMWFLVPLSSQPITKFYVIMGNNMMKSIDLGWMEILGGQGVNSSIKLMSQLNQTIQVKSYSLLVFLMICSAVLISFLLVN